MMPAAAPPARNRTWTGSSRRYSRGAAPASAAAWLRATGGDRSGPGPLDRRSRGRYPRSNPTRAVVAGLKAVPLGQFAGHLADLLGQGGRLGQTRHRLDRQPRHPALAGPSPSVPSCAASSDPRPGPCSGGGPGRRPPPRNRPTAPNSPPTSIRRGNSSGPPFQPGSSTKNPPSSRWAEKTLWIRTPQSAACRRSWWKYSSGS